MNSATAILRSLAILPLNAQGNGAFEGHDECTKRTKGHFQRITTSSIWSNIHLSVLTGVSSAVEVFESEWYGVSRCEVFLRA